MAENAYTAVTDVSGTTHTVTRTTGLSVVTGQVAFTFRGGATKIEVMEAFKAIRRVIRQDGQDANLPSSYPTSGSVVS